MAYTLCAGNGFLKSNEIIDMLNPDVPLQLAHIQAIRDLEVEGCRYSNHDFDVLSAGYRCAVNNETTVDKYAAKWVEVMTAKAHALLEEAKEAAHARECEAAAMAVLRERNRKRAA
jgi:hypothetical protein